MRLLTDQDRAFILDQLKLAPDSVLADAMLAFNAIRDKLVAVRQLTSKSEFNNSLAAPKTEPVAVPTERPNVDPGKPTIGKIGTETKQAILGLLASKQQPPAKYTEHLKLLWYRNEVKFDGKKWYL